MRVFTATILSLLMSCLESNPAHAGTIRSLPVPVETIYPGQTIVASQLTKRRFQTTANSLRGVATEDGEITGREARRRLPAGKPIPLSGLQSPLTIRRGATAMASFSEDGLSISMPVTALQDGETGDVIDARNPATGAMIKVLVIAEGIVRVSAE